MGKLTIKEGTALLEAEILTQEAYDEMVMIGKIGERKQREKRIFKGTSVTPCFYFGGKKSFDGKLTKEMKECKAKVLKVFEEYTETVKQTETKQ